jgi:NAD(P)-dependent dehydrogenase (short-subunit alcohol dehydrogenase family)
MEISLKNRVAIVTGAAMGIGLACAQELAASGAKIAVVDRQSESVIASAVQTIQKNGIAKGYRMDVTDIPGITKTFEQIRKEMGEIDILVCVAGVDLGPTIAEQCPPDKWDFVHDINVKGVFFCNQAAAAQSMIPRKKGAIVNMASAVGLVGAPTCIAYNTSKAAVVQMTRSLAIDWAKYNIRVNAVGPTWVHDTQIGAVLDNAPGFKEHELSKIPLGRFATAKDVAKAVCFLASDDAANMITGVTLAVDGGWTAW